MREQQIKLIKEKRKNLLKEEVKTWRENCEPCTLIREAISKGELSPSTDCTRQNPVCSACPIHKKMRDYGHKLEELMGQERFWRG